MEKDDRPVTRAELEAFRAEILDALGTVAAHVDFGVRFIAYLHERRQPREDSVADFLDVAARIDNASADIQRHDNTARVALRCFTEDHPVPRE